MAPDPSEVYSDDASVPDGELLFRMILASNTKFDEQGTALRAGTNAFQDYPESGLGEVGAPAVAVSVYLESALNDHSVEPPDLVARWGSEYGIASITAGQARAEGQGIVRWPMDGHPEHGMIFCLEGSRKTSGQSKRLARASTIVIPPPPPA